MLLSPADPGSARAQEAGVPGQSAYSGTGEAWMAAPLAESPVSYPRGAGSLARADLRASDMMQSGVTDAGQAQASLRSGGCFVRALPLDATCASAARRFLREAVAGCGLPSDLVHDGVTMASELAANTLNAHGNVEFAGSAHRPVSGFPELWIYLRTSGSGRELVCKVFDSEPDWEAFEPAAESAFEKASPDSVRGRGLQLVAGLSAGRWGHHPSRARMGSWKVPGKAIWFALRIPPGSDLARSPRTAPRGSEAIAELAAALADRGLGTGLAATTAPSGDLAVLSVSHGLTVWCHGDLLWWKAPDGGYDRLAVTDLVEACERIVWAHEELVGRRHIVGAEPVTAEHVLADQRAGD
jgi:anti-sigma regulatory factor (Ser/Thr protein kinase)